MKETPVRAVLFDWDGTLVDTAEPAYRCYVRMFADFGIHFDRDIYASTYSPAWQHTYRCLNLPEERWVEADGKWLSYFEEEMMAPLIDGAAGALETLARRKVMSGIVTSGTRGRIVRELAALRVDHHFTQVVCGDDGPLRKPAPDALLFCLERMGIRPEEAAYVGDSAEDIQMARAANVRSVAVRGPYPNHDSLVAASADFIAHSLGHAIDHLLGREA